MLFTALSIEKDPKDYFYKHRRKFAVEYKYEISSGAFMLNAWSTTSTVIFRDDGNIKRSSLVQDVNYKVLGVLLKVVHGPWVFLLCQPPVLQEVGRL